MQENLARQQYRQLAAEAVRLGNAAHDRQELAVTVRSDAVAGLRRNLPAVSGWRMGLFDAEILDTERQRLATMASRVGAAAEAARELTVNCLRDLRQAEILLSSAARSEERERLRREQKQADDWFQSRRTRRQRRSN